MRGEHPKYGAAFSIEAPRWIAQVIAVRRSVLLSEGQMSDHKGASRVLDALPPPDP